MDQTVKALLAGKETPGLPHVFPFLWMHGEPEAVIREYMAAIYNANIRGVCVESRPHPDYCGPQWWHDMEIILDEARSRNMKVWILDGSHFPTGFAGGGLKDREDSLRRQFLVRVELGRASHDLVFEKPLSECAVLPDWQPKGTEQFQEAPRTFPGDRLLGIAALRQDRPEARALSLSDVIRFQPGEGEWKLYGLLLTHNRGPHREYINMISEESCRVLIDAVYEPHWQHFQKDFGKTIAGFFSDEPELGNGHLYEMGKKLWELDDLPWSDELEQSLQNRWGDSLPEKLALLWDKDAGAQARCDFMDALTRLVERDFSRQLGDWCRDHGVEYIGHLIEDNDQHQRTGSSLGHYFRGLSGQDMAGIDDIGGQVFPQGEWDGPNGPAGAYRGGLFYHYVLGKLGASFAAIDPKKQGRCMCEIFGAYGWEEGVRLEKYLADHFLVRGVNYFVPHAFSMKEYPDLDCPPHFYAHGHNPQYRHFGALMAYIDRVARLFTGGVPQTPIALLYTAEADWAGETMQLQTTAAPLYDRQIDYHILPSDVFSQPERYNAKCEDALAVNGQRYRALVIPRCQYLPGAAAKCLHALKEHGCEIVFAGGYPQGVTGGEAVDFSAFPAVQPEELPAFLDSLSLTEVRLTPADDRVRCYLYRGETLRCMLVNEGTETYRGKILLPEAGSCYAYNAWENWLETVDARTVEDGTEIALELEPLHSLILLFDQTNGALTTSFKPEDWEEKLPWNAGWQRSVCPSVEYPRFTGETPLDLPDRLAEQLPDFSGFARYEKPYFCEEPGQPVWLEIADAYEGVELFVNGKSAGIQIAPPFRYDLTELLSPGENLIRIEVATTLERENAKNPDPMREYMGLGPKIPKCPSGINGAVFLFREKQGLITQ